MNKSETLETLYDKYGRIIYGIVLKYISNIPDAERIVCALFKNIDLNEVNNLRKTSVCRFLVYEAIRHVKLEKGDFIRKKDPVEKVNYINEILFDQKSLDELCEENKSSRLELFKKVRLELSGYRDSVPVAASRVSR